MTEQQTATKINVESFDGAAPDHVWAGVAQVFQRAFSAAPYFEDPAELGSIVHWGPERLASVGGRLVIVRSEEKIVGFALGHRIAGDQHWKQTLAQLDPQDLKNQEVLNDLQGSVVVDELAVDEDYRWRGLAKACLRSLISDREESRVVLGVFQQAPAAKLMYLAWGFSELGMVHVQDGAVSMHVLTAMRSQLSL